MSRKIARAARRWGAPGVLAGSALAVLGRSGWWLADVAAAFAAQWLLAAAAVAVVTGVRRRWGALATALLAAGVHAWGIALPRAPRAEGTPDLVVMMFNAATGNRTPERALDAIVHSGADVVALAEPSDRLLDLVRASPGVAAAYPHREIPDAARGGYRAILSRWPAETIEAWRRDEMGKKIGGRAVRVQTPGGPVLLMLIHPDSPRSAADWARGNAVVERACRFINEELRPQGAPIVLLADLNAAPSSSRSWAVWRSTGLRRCKPLAAPTGTWPAGLPWPAQVAIDDAFVSEGVRVTSWRTIGGTGSDHRAVAVGLDLPGGP